MVVGGAMVVKSQPRSSFAQHQSVLASVQPSSRLKPFGHHCNSFLQQYSFFLSDHPVAHFSKSCLQSYVLESPWRTQPVSKSQVMFGFGVAALHWYGCPVRAGASAISTFPLHFAPPWLQHQSFFLSDQLLSMSSNAVMQSNNGTVVVLVLVVVEVEVVVTVMVVVVPVEVVVVVVAVVVVLVVVTVCVVVVRVVVRVVVVVVLVVVVHPTPWCLQHHEDFSSVHMCAQSDRPLSQAYSYECVVVVVVLVSVRVSVLVVVVVFVDVAVVVFVEVTVVVVVLQPTFS